MQPRFFFKIWKNRKKPKEKPSFVVKKKVNTFVGMYFYAALSQQPEEAIREYRLKFPLVQIPKSLFRRSSSPTFPKSLRASAAKDFEDNGVKKTARKRKHDIYLEGNEQEENDSSSRAAKSQALLPNGKAARLFHYVPEYDNKIDNFIQQGIIRGAFKPLETAWEWHCRRKRRERNGMCIEEYPYRLVMYGGEKWEEPAKSITPASFSKEISHTAAKAVYAFLVAHGEHYFAQVETTGKPVVMAKSISKDWQLQIRFFLEEMSNPDSLPQCIWNAKLVGLSTEQC